MRNTLKYPVTKVEVVAMMNRLLNELSWDGRIGNIEGYALRLARDWIEKNGPQEFRDEAIAIVKDLQ